MDGFETGGGGGEGEGGERRGGCEQEGEGEGEMRGAFKHNGVLFLTTWPMFPFPACAGEIAAGDRFFGYFFRANTAPAAEGRRAPQALAPAPGLDVRRGALLTALNLGFPECAAYSLWRHDQGSAHSGVSSFLQKKVKPEEKEVRHTSLKSFQPTGELGCRRLGQSCGPVV